MFSFLLFREFPGPVDVAVSNNRKISVVCSFYLSFPSYFHYMYLKFSVKEGHAIRFQLWCSG